VFFGLLLLCFPLEATYLEVVYDVVRKKNKTLFFRLYLCWTIIIASLFLIPGHSSKFRLSYEEKKSCTPVTYATGFTVAILLFLIGFTINQHFSPLEIIWVQTC